MSTSSYKQFSPPELQYSFIGERIVNNKLNHIHKVNINRCPLFFITDKDEVVFFIKDTGEQWYMSLNPMVNRFSMLPETDGSYTKKSILTSMNIEIVMVYNEICKHMPDLTEARRFLHNIKPSGEIVFEIGFIHDNTWKSQRFATYSQTNQIILLQPVILCLTIGDFCVSSIEMELEDDETFVEIRSKTNEGYRRRHYNTIMRALAIMVIPLIWTNAMHVISYASNSLSVHTMVSKFDAKTNNPEIQGKSRPEIEKHMYSSDEIIPIVIPLSSETLARAKNVFSQYTL